MPCCDCFVRVSYRSMWPGARLTKTYDITIQRYSNSHAKIEDSKMHVLWCMVQNFVWNFKGAFEISHKILNPYTAKYAFYEVLKIWRLMIS